MEEWSAEGERKDKMQVDGERGQVMNGSEKIMTYLSRIAQ